MSTSAGQQRRTDAISPTDEEAVKQVLMESVLGLWDVVNGLMQAANEGAAARGGRAQSMGIRVDLPFEQEVTLPDLSGTPRTLSDLEAIGNAAGAGFWARVQALGDKPYHQPSDLPGFPI